MDDGRCLGDYVLHGHVPRLEVSLDNSYWTFLCTYVDIYCNVMKCGGGRVGLDE